MEVVAVLISAFLTTSVAYLVYQYRGLITYEQLSLRAKISFDGRDIKVSDRGNNVVFDYVKIRNRGYTAVENFELHHDVVYGILGHEVLATTSVGKNTITVEQTANSICISARALPRGEIIEILLIFPGRNSFWDAKGGGSKYRIRTQAYFDGMSGSFSFFKTLLFIGLLNFFIWNVIRNVQL